MKKYKWGLFDENSGLISTRFNDIKFIPIFETKKEAVKFIKQGEYINCTKVIIKKVSLRFYR